jgi:hypothetical protein
MHIADELAEVATEEAQEFTEVIEEYEEEVLVQEEVPEQLPADFADFAPAQGKPRCITPIFIITENIYICCAFTLQELLWNPHA